MSDSKDTSFRKLLETDISKINVTPSGLVPVPAEAEELLLEFQGKGKSEPSAEELVALKEQRKVFDDEDDAFGEEILFKGKPISAFTMEDIENL